ncbi:MAG: IMP dehydrogenase [bacterium]|nr:IMP dehydrogenase [bacterium]
MDALGKAVSFDHVRLKTGYSEVMPDDVSLHTRLSRNIPLRSPIVSAAMDTVTEYRLAIEIAKWGGIGFIHRNLPPEEQAFQVAQVKLHLNGRIDRPRTVKTTDTIERVLAYIREKKFAFDTFPVLDGDEKLAGMLTKTDFEFCTDPSLVVSEVMSRELVTARCETTIDEAYNLMRRSKKKVLPLIDDNGRLCGMYVWQDVLRIKTGSGLPHNVDKNGNLRVGAAIGVGDKALERVELLARKKIDAVCIDTAHGDSRSVHETLREIKRHYPDLDVVVGNVSEGASARRLVDAGADAIKIGQGPGSICTTRVIAGIGCPQVTAIYQCEKAIRGSGVPLIADGGIRHSGDIPIAIGAGADSVMLGNLLAGTKEAPGEITTYRGMRYKSYRGMGSIGALQSNLSNDRYGQKEPQPKDRIVPEGVEGMVPYKDEIREVLIQLLGGLRKGMGYVGAATIKELKEKADFCSPVDMQESHPHDVIITKEPPNYRITPKEEN